MSVDHHLLISCVSVHLLFTQQSSRACFLSLHGHTIGVCVCVCVSVLNADYYQIRQHTYIVCNCTLEQLFHVTTNPWLGLGKDHSLG